MTAVEICAKLTDYFASRACLMPEIAILQPADPFLETAGEDLRRRIYITGDEHGDALCLRPEFTIPVCLHHLAHPDALPQRYAYCGTVFRQHRDGSSEFQQAGIEDFGRADVAAADIDCLADAHGALASAGVQETRTIFGDQTLFEAVVAALGLPQGWQTRLVRAFGDEDQLTAHVARLSGVEEQPASSMDTNLLELINAGEVAAVEDAVAAEMKKASLPPASGRTAVEIARRAIVKARLAATRLDTAQASALTSFLAIDVSAEDAGAALGGFERDHALDLGAARTVLLDRFSMLRERGLPLGTMRYKASFGRRLDYYTGMLFEIYSSENERPVIGGGRYDRLLTLLGSKSPVPAVGFSIWPGRLIGEGGGQ